jgi:hypothetical protein
LHSPSTCILFTNKERTCVQAPISSYTRHSKARVAKGGLLLEMEADRAGSNLVVHPAF